VGGLTANRYQRRDCLSPKTELIKRLGFPGPRMDGAGLNVWTDRQRDRSPLRELWHAPGHQLFAV
jgi:hypothetical protein